MPLIRVDVLRGRPERELEAIVECVHGAMVAQLGVPERDRFAIVTEHDPGRLIFDRTYLDVARSDAFVLLRLTLAAGRSTDAKQAFYADVCERLVATVELRPQDLTVVLVENDREDWSFGNGEASYVVLPRERWR